MAGGGAIEAVRERVARLESIIGPVDADGVESISTRMDDLHESVQRLETMLNEFSEEMRARLSLLEADMTLVKRTVAEIPGETVSNGKMKVPEPKAFNGARSAKELENFLWDMEQYFAAARIPDVEQVTFTSMYLSGDAKLWWRTRMSDDASTGRPRIDSWERLKKEMKDQFLPCNASWVARDSLKRLKQSGTVRDYVKEFSSLMLDIQNMSEEDKLFNFMSGLQPWAQMELRRQNVKDLPSAFAAADGLVDFKLSKDASLIKGKGERLKGGKKNGGDYSSEKGKADGQSLGSKY